MKKIIFLLLALTIVSWASALQTQREIYKTILSAIFPNKHTVYIWLDDPSKRDIFSKLRNIKIVTNRENADILIVYHTFDINATDKKIFADGYLVFKHYKEKIIGGFYWQKGRPNLVFIRKNLEDFNITLPKNLKEFIEDNF